MKIVTVAGILLGLGLAVRACAAEPVRENIEWLDVWLPHTNEHSLPRILLIGDSITRGYGKQVEANLKDKAYVGRMATSKSLGDPALVEQVILILREQSFDIIHFNNGMHGDGYSEDAYAEALPELVAALRRNAPRARLIWCSTTDVRERNNLSTLAARGRSPVGRAARDLRPQTRREENSNAGPLCRRATKYAGANPGRPEGCGGTGPSASLRLL